MDNKMKKSKKALKAYGSLGAALMAAAGAIVGLVLGGPIMAVPGVVAGFIVGQVLEKQAAKLKPKRR